MRIGNRHLIKDGNEGASGCLNMNRFKKMNRPFRTDDCFNCEHEKKNTQVAWESK